MANLALSTQIPQIGDSSQQLLARMAAAAADQNQNPSTVTALASAARTTSQYITISLPQGARALFIKLNVTAVPGVDTLNLLVGDGTVFSTLQIGRTGASAIAGPHLIIVRENAASFANPGYVNTTITTGGLCPSILIAVEHSGAGSFTYSLTYQFLKT